MAVPDLNLRYIPTEEELLAFSCFMENNLYANLHNLTYSFNSIDKAAMLYTSVKTPDECPHQELCDNGEAASLCTEEEMVAIEQLTKLKRKQMEEEEEELSSFHSGSLAAYIPSPLTGPSSHPSSESLHLASTSTTSSVFSEIAPLKDFIPASSSHEAISTDQHSSSTREHNDNINIFVNIEVDELEDQDLISFTPDFDDRPKPKIRKLSDIYSHNGNMKLPARINDTARSSSSPAGSSDKLHHDLCNINKVMSSKRRRKAINMLIMKKATVLHQ